MINRDDICTTIIKDQKESNSVTFETFKIPEYLKAPIDYNSVISIDTKDYLSLKCNLDKNELSEIENSTIDTAISWIDNLRKIVEHQEMWWDEPLVNINHEGEIVFEWWHQKRKITVYVLQENIDYIKIWGKDIDNEMEEGALTSSEDISLLWQWISFSNS